MKLTVFNAGDGDGLLLTSKGPKVKRMLIDGGRKAAYDKHMRRFLGDLRDEGKLDVVCVSHIDEDHISGVLRLVADETDWRAHEFLASLDPDEPEPKAPRPPDVGEVWHNGLFALVGDDVAPVVESVLSSVATVLAGSADARLRDVASQLDDLATGEEASMELSRRLSPEQLDIKLNPRSGGALMKRGGKGESVTLGSLKIAVLGPSQDNIDELRVEWQKWIDDNQGKLEALQRRMLDEEDRLGTLSPRIVANPMLDQALGEGLQNVTEANVASLMLLVKEGSKSVLLTGDGISGEILDGLEHHGELDSKGRIHVNVLKVPHHGAKGNVETRLVQQVTADHYVFCGNGAHHNPEVEVVEAFIEARLRGIDGKAAVGPKKPFKLWFTSSSKTPGLSATRKSHMKLVEKKVAALQKGHTSRVSAELIVKESFFEIAL